MTQAKQESVQPEITRQDIESKLKKAIGLKDDSIDQDAIIYEIFCHALSFHPNAATTVIAGQSRLRQVFPNLTLGVYRIDANNKYLHHQDHYSEIVEGIVQIQDYRQGEEGFFNNQHTLSNFLAIDDVTKSRNPITQTVLTIMNVTDAELDDITQKINAQKVEKRKRSSY